MCYWKQLLAFVNTYQAASFNPSYTGCATGSSGSENLAAIGKNGVSILLILDVLLEADVLQVKNAGITAGFNPSYTGCATGSL